MGSKVRVGKKYPAFKPFNLTVAREHAFGAFFGKQKFKVKVVFDQVAAPFIREKIWNKSQVVKEIEDGRVEFEITVCDLVEIKSWILSWGGHAKAISPKKLVTEVANDLTQASMQYN